MKAIRKKAGMTQSEFADSYGLPIGSVRDWEQGRSAPDRGSLMYLRLIEADPKAMRSMVERLPQ